MKIQRNRKCAQIQTTTSFVRRWNDDYTADHLAPELSDEPVGEKLTIAQAKRELRDFEKLTRSLGCDSATRIWIDGERVHSLEDVEVF